MLLLLAAVAAPPKRLGAGPEEDGALVEVAAGLLAPKEKAGLGAAGESGEERGHKVVKVTLRSQQVGRTTTTQIFSAVKSGLKMGKKKKKNG